MKGFKLTTKIIAAILLIISPFLIVFSTAFLSSAEFDESFVGALDVKLDRLYSIEGEKVVIIGGSSTAFGYDSSLIEKYLDKPVVNMGLYAALGTKVMLDLSRNAIGKGDIVIIAPELDAQTLSLYFSPSTTLRALDGSPEYLLSLPAEHRMSLFAESWGFAAEKLSYKLFGGAKYEGIYRADSFNELGDIKVARPNNIMSEYYDREHTVDLDADILDPDFISYLNEYIAYARSVGAKVYFEFCPINSLGLSEGSESEQARLIFEERLRDSLDCTVIAASIEDYIYRAEYFYDTNLHLNSAGAVMHTVNVIRDLLLELEMPISVTEEIPAPPPLPELDIRYSGEDANADSFIYERKANGTYKIVGVAPAHLSDTSLTVPLGYNGYKVTEIGRAAFSGSSVKKLTVTADTNLTFFESGAFIGADKLSALYIYYPYEQDIAPPPSFSGVASDFKVYIPSDSSYRSGYYWSQCGARFEYID
ncbi:MAG: hypothetical protein IKV16_05775 [Clostridia bacterium]|nr:hypothetical protein [Clostridia bacterium]